MTLREFIQFVEQLKSDGDLDFIIGSSATMVQRMPKEYLDAVSQEDVIDNVKVLANTELLLMLIDQGGFDA